MDKTKTAKRFNEAHNALAEIFKDWLDDLDKEDPVRAGHLRKVIASPRDELDYLLYAGLAIITKAPNEDADSIEGRVARFAIRINGTDTVLFDLEI